MTDTERRQSVPHGQVTWTARRALRRMLEHQAKRGEAKWLLENNHAEHAHIAVRSMRRAA